MNTQKDINPFPYSDTNKRYHTYAYFLRQKFSAKCVKLSVDGGFTCPNRDGSKGIGGCIYCSERGSGDFCADASRSVPDQLADAYRALGTKWDHPLGIAYFQAFTNTYAPVPVLRERFESALAFPWVVGISIATRADCLSEEVCAYLADLAKRTFLTVELGLQTIHDATAARINRQHSFADFKEGYDRLRAASSDIHIGIHLIDGLPGESPAMMLESARVVGCLHPDLVKIHLLHVIRGTPLETLYTRGEFECMTLEDYTALVAAQLEQLPAECVIGRLTGDGAADQLIAPRWSRNKLVVLNTIDRILYETKSYQGRLFQK